MAKQNKTNIGIDKRAKEVADAVVERSKLNQTECTARLFEWFNTLPADIQGIALGQIPDTYGPDLARAILQSMGEQPVKPLKLLEDKSQGTPQRKKAARHRGQDESRGEKE